MKTYHLEEWAIKSNDSPYIAPECRKIKLTGFRVEDRKYVTTSTIVKAVGNCIYTRSGSVYILGKVNPDYKQWMKDKKIKFDPNNPITIRK